jgi:hypothetical protein
MDMTAYAIWLEERLDLWSAKKRKWWDDLEQRVQPGADGGIEEQQTPKKMARREDLDAANSPPIPAPTKTPKLARSDWSSRL